MKQNWPVNINIPIVSKTINSKNPGSTKKNGTTSVPMHIAKKLFKIRIVKTESFPDNIFMQIISKPIIRAPKRQSNAMGSTLKSKDGRNNKRPPEKENNAAPHLIKPTFSLNINTAKIIAKIGLRKVKAVASLTGIYKMEVNKIDTPNQPKMERRRCNFTFKNFTLSLKIYQKETKKINEKKNLA